VVGTKGGHQVPALQQHHADERLDLSRLQGYSLGFREPRIRIDVAHDNGLATLEGGAQRRRKRPCPFRSGKRCDTGNVFTPNDVLAVFELRVADTVYAQVFTEQPRGDFLHVERMAQRPQRIGELEKERFPLLGRDDAREGLGTVFIPDRRFRHVEPPRSYLSLAQRLPTDGRAAGRGHASGTRGFSTR
jgi:hypothetical protein